MRTSTEPQRAPRDAFAAARQTFETLVTKLQDDDALSMSHDALERMLEGEGKELLRQLLQDHLELRRLFEERQRSVTGNDGVERTHVRERTRTLKTLFGDVDVTRLAFCARGQDSRMPLDAELNLPRESFSLGLRKRVAWEAARGSFDDVVETLAMQGVQIGKRQVEQLAGRAAVDFDAFYALREQRESGPFPPSPAEPKLLVISTDGKGVVMRKESLREATRKAAESSSRKLDKRLSKGEKRNRKRMAQVAAVYEVAPFVRRPVDVAFDLKPIPENERPRPPRPENKRVWASVEKPAEAVIFEAFEEALRRDPDKQMRWVVLVDGNESQLDTIERCERHMGLELTIIVDVIHVLEYLWQAGLCLEKEGSQKLEAWVTEHFLSVLEGRASLVAAGIRQSATKRKLTAKQREPIDRCARYLLKHKRRLKYDEYLREGLPIATGVIEGTCRYLINDRMDITGARWGLPGAEAVLRLRALRASKDFEEYWQFHLEQEAKRNHLERYEGDPPATRSPDQRPKLRVIPGGSSS